MTEEEIFDAVVQLPESAREAFLQRACESDVKLLDSVRKLLRYHAESSGFMKSPAIDTLIDTDTMLQPDSVIGSYRLLEPLGQGGMGIVYRAVQSEPVEREVAIKVIKPGLDTREIVARFRAEQRALAVMDHPFIAKVFEAGVTTNGRPYFVMELADGPSITEYCDRNKLGIEERLRLLIDVCLAVQHAHSKSIIHRDIKPTNVLVVQQDGKPIPKIIDFGVAKTFDRDPTDQTFVTQTTQVIGTPIYMSPEQADTSIQDIDTRTDIYSLGVLTYELLTGCTPFDRDRLRRMSIDEVRRVIREEEPPRPSSRISGLREKARELALARGEEPKRLIRMLRDDLDWIVLKAIEKDRDRRYATAIDFAGDLHRFLNYEPVLASPPGRLYRLKRVAWRNRVAVAVSATMLLLLILGTVGTSIGLWQSRELNKRLLEVLASERNQARAAEESRQIANQSLQYAEIEKARALIEQDTTAAVVQFLTQDLLSASTPSMQEGKGHDVRMRDVLMIAGKKIEKEAATGGRFHNKPQVEAQIRYTIGQTFVSLGLPSEAISHLERAKQLLEGDWANDQQRLPTLYILSEAYNNIGKMTEGIELAKLVVESSKRLYGADSEKAMEATYNLAAQLLYVGRFEESCELFSRVHENRMKNHGPNEWVTLETEISLATAYVKIKKFEKAEELFGRVLAIARERQDPYVIGSVLKLMAEIRLEQNRIEDARTMLQESHDNLSKHHGPEHAATVLVLGLLGLVDSSLGDYEASREKLTTAYQVGLKTSGPVGSMTVTTRLNLTATLWDGNHRKEADELITQHLAETVETWGRDNIWVRRIFFQIDLMAEAYESEGQIAHAEPFRKLSLEHHVALASAKDALIEDLRQAALALADTRHDNLRDVNRALGFMEQALQIARKSEPSKVESLETELARIRSLTSAQ